MTLPRSRYSAVPVRSCRDGQLPVGWLVVLEKLTPYMASAAGTADDGVDNARSPVHDVQGRMKPLLCRFSRGNLHRILIGDPSGIDAVHVDTVRVIVGG